MQKRSIAFMRHLNRSPLSSSITKLLFHKDLLATLRDALKAAYEALEANTYPAQDMPYDDFVKKFGYAQSHAPHKAAEVLKLLQPHVTPATP